MIFSLHFHTTPPGQMLPSAPVPFSEGGWMAAGTVGSVLPKGSAPTRVFGQGAWLNPAQKSPSRTTALLVFQPLAKRRL